MDIYDLKGISPMLLTEISEPRESGEWLNELKLDGIRAIAYLCAGSAELRNKRDMRMLPAFPELNRLHRAVNSKCILDGELIISGANGRPDFETLQARSLTTDCARVRVQSARTPASYVAFDILYLEGRDLTALPLDERKRILGETVREGNRMAVSRVIDGSAQALFRLTKEQGLEGIVQKRKASPYRMGKRSHDWVKVKNLIDEDFLACGYIVKDARTTSLALGTYVDGTLIYQGHVTLGVSRAAAERYPTASRCPFGAIPPGNEAARWYASPPVCTVVYMERTGAGGMRQPRFKGFRDDASQRS